ncbi:MAG: alpha/beta hydrolase [Firmicutes bacterium]|nr:alpha/beta hydrolase [Bacillota bacterium]
MERNPEAAPKSVPNTPSERLSAPITERNPDPAPGLLWIHGGGYFLGMKEMALFSRAAALVGKYGVTVVSPGYRLSWQKPYPAAVEDCYEALVYMYEHAEQWGIDPRKIMVGGESAGGGLAVAVCMMARDKGTVPVRFQFPLYPMLSNVDTESSKDNHGKVWNTRRNHLGWWTYLRHDAKKEVSPYASPAWQTDYRGLPPCYTFVGDGEPFYTETLDYVRHLKEAGVSAEVDVYHSDRHAFDLMRPGEEPGRSAIRRFEKYFDYVLKTYLKNGGNNI